MKSKRTGILFALLMAAGMMLTTACTTEETKTDGKAKVENSEGTAKEVVDKSGKEYTSAFVCPMHCEGSGSDVAGKCPVCN
ncbi:MAG TPA: hypothetical protein ENJ82_05415, partial [Bacteroidetes bacterium]|nr:hypothetical protein [Bacteroidota bacterium]